MGVDNHGQIYVSFGQFDFDIFSKNRENKLLWSFFLEFFLSIKKAAIVTPRVRTVVRNHFNCQKLEGAQLENQVRLF